MVKSPQCLKTSKFTNAQAVRRSWTHSRQSKLVEVVEADVMKMMKKLVEVRGSCGSRRDEEAHGSSWKLWKQT